MVRFAPVLEAVSGTSAVDLEVAYGALGIDGGEAVGETPGDDVSEKEDTNQTGPLPVLVSRAPSGWLIRIKRTIRKVSYAERISCMVVPKRARLVPLAGGRFVGVGYRPTLEVASVREFSVLDLPALGFPTRPIKGSRGILNCVSLLKMICGAWISI